MTDISQLQNYIKTKRAEYISMVKPEYEVLFYSRYNTTTDVISLIKNNQQYSSTNPVPTLESGTISPNATLTSAVNTVSRTGVSVIQNINISNSVSNPDGSSATIEMLNPVGIDYFLPTIGSANKTSSVGGTDYDYSLGLPIASQKIGNMDTVIIKIKNNKPGFNTSNIEQDVVFRGVIRRIQRTESVQEGSKITIILSDFSEFLRRINAIPLGFFSTISFSLTGRQLVSNLLKYSNRIYTGDWSFLGKDVLGSFRQQAQQIDDNYIAQLGTQGADSKLQEQNAQEALSDSQNHKLSIPPFFFLEFSNTDVQINTPPSLDDYSYNANNIDPSGNQQSPQDAITDVFKNLISQSNSLSNFLQSGILNQTPEDGETLRTYQIALEEHANNSTLNKNFIATSNENLTISGQLEKYAWILSDIYLGKGVITFENQRIWPLMVNVAHRAMREVYFDFSPKIAPNPVNPYVTATVPEIKSATLANIHPNIGILKYRLSPCMKPYDENNTVNTYINQYSIDDDEVIRYDSIETEEDVYTAVFGFGSGLDSGNYFVNSKQQTAIVAGQGNLLAFAQSIDPRIETRLGYRFMTDSDQKIQIPILMYLTSYVILMQSQMNMFAAQVSVVGNPKYKPGSIVRLQTKNVDYYCADVSHAWSQSGYVTTLYLSYGHTSGVLPAALTGGNSNDNVAENQQCITRSNTLAKYVAVNKNVGNVNAHCLISAMWQFMACGASDNASLQALSPDFENSAPKNVTYTDWIDYVHPDITPTVRFCSGGSYSAPSGFQPYPFDDLQHQVENQIQYLGLDKYGVSYNLIKNLVALESAFCQNAGSNVGALGLFQIYSGKNAQRDIYNPIQSMDYALSLLKQKFIAAGCVSNQFSPQNYLNAIAFYNGIPNGCSGPNFYTCIDRADGATQPYVNLVLGSQQVQDILSGTKQPSNIKSYSATTGVSLCQPGGPGIQAWPYKVYGPIGERLDAYLEQNPNTKVTDAKNTLLDFNKGMTAGVAYILGLLNKYSNKRLPGADNKNGAGAWVDNNNLISKVVAAWYSNENLNNVTGANSALLKKTIDSINSLYNECRNCTGQLAVTGKQFDYTKNQALANINFRFPCDNAKVTCKAGVYRPASIGSPAHYHEGIDVANFGVGVAPTDGGPCLAPADGVIVQQYHDPANGWSIIILHSDINNGIISRYFDLWNPSFQIGDSVTKGQIIAQANAPAGAITGETGNHIHMEIRVGAKCTINPPSCTDIGKWIDPLTVIKS